MHAFPKHRSFLSIAHAALMFLGTCAPAHATGTLSFTGGGYWIDLEIGEAEVAQVAAVRFHGPGDAQGLVLPRECLSVEAFDPASEKLVLRCACPDQPGSPAFTLSADRAEAVLEIDARRIASSFDWSL